MRLSGEVIVVSGNIFGGTDYANVGGAHVDGIQFFPGGERKWLRNARIEGNRFEDCYQAIFLTSKEGDYASSITVIGNTFIDMRDTVVTGDNVQGLDVLGNAFKDQEKVCIRWRSGSTGREGGNVFENSPNYESIDGGSVVERVEWPPAVAPTPTPTPTLTPGFRMEPTTDGAVIHNTQGLWLRIEWGQ
jgi:hypothetical protein